MADLTDEELRALDVLGGSFCIPSPAATLTPKSERAIGERIIRAVEELQRRRAADNTHAVLSPDEVAQLQHHVRDHRVTCATSCSLIERLMATDSARLTKERVRQVVREIAEDMARAAELIDDVRPYCIAYSGRLADRVADRLCEGRRP